MFICFKVSEENLKIKFYLYEAPERTVVGSTKGTSVVARIWE